MIRLYHLRFPGGEHQAQIIQFLHDCAHGAAVREAILSLRLDPRPERFLYADIRPETELPFLVPMLGRAWGEELDHLFKRLAPRCRITAAGCDVIYDIDDKDCIVYLFVVRPSGSQ